MRTECLDLPAVFSAQRFRRFALRLPLASLGLCLCCTCGAPLQQASHLPVPQGPQATSTASPVAALTVPASAPAESVFSLSSPTDDLARRLADKALSDPAWAEIPSDAEQRARFLWLRSARAAVEGQSGLRQSSLAELAALRTPLAVPARLVLAESYLPSAPQQALDALAGTPETDWYGARSARSVRGRALLALGRPEGVDILRGVVAETPSHIGAATPGMPLADFLALSTNDGERLEALQLYRRIFSRAPASTIGREANTKAESLLRRLPESLRLQVASLPAADRLARGRALVDSGLSAEGEAVLRELFTAEGIPAGVRCEAKSILGTDMVKRRNRLVGAELLHTVGLECEGLDLRAWALYRAGRAFSQESANERALASYSALERVATTHSLADDAAYRTALVQREMGDLAAANATFQRLIAAYPHGDMADDVRFTLAEQARAEGRLAEALALIEQSLSSPALAATEAVEGLAGRASYWRGKILRQMGRNEDAVRVFQACMEEHPLTYYSMLAAVSLTELDALLPVIPAPAQVDPVLPREAAHDSEWFARVQELASVHEFELVLAEAEAQGVFSAEREGPNASLTMQASVVALLSASGGQSRVIPLFRKQLRDFRRASLDDGFWLWRLAYPQVFADAVIAASTSAGVPPSLVWAVAREESSFDPRALSPASAHGLVQLLLQTARAHARPEDGSITATTLFDPAVNTRLGARFMRAMLTRFNNREALLPAAYNAGQGALSRWLTASTNAPLDEFVEAIPYDETRRYTRRVLQSWFIYTWLDEQRLLLPSSSGALPELAPAS